MGNTLCCSAEAGLAPAVDGKSVGGADGAAGAASNRDPPQQPPSSPGSDDEPLFVDSTHDGTLDEEPLFGESTLLDSSPLATERPSRNSTS